MRDLDDASIRRFNHKVQFDYLLPVGNVVFYEKLLVSLLDSPLDGKSRAALKNIPNLTPGDFKTVRDRFAFYPAEDLSHELLLEALEEESRIKNERGCRVRIGF
jgi:hypothetical protein